MNKLSLDDNINTLKAHFDFLRHYWKPQPDLNVLNAISKSIYVLEKQKPKKIFSAYSDERGIIFGDCPTCSFAQNSLWNSKYCGNCGQKLDWSE